MILEYLAKYYIMQGDQLNMVVFFWYRVNVTCCLLVYTTVTYTGKSVLARYQKNIYVVNLVGNNIGLHLSAPILKCPSK